MDLKAKKKSLSKTKPAASSTTSQTPISKTKPSAEPAIKPAILQPANPDFENLVKGSALEPKKENRGGLRPGAGRPQGVTDDLAAVNRLPEKANEALCAVLEMPFDLWADVNKMPELALSKDEARKLGLPVTQLLEFYFPGKIPVIAWVWMSLLGSTANIVKPRLKMLRQRKAAGKAAGGGPGTLPTRQVPASGPPNSVPPAKGFVNLKIA